MAGGDFYQQNQDLWGHRIFPQPNRPFFIIAVLLELQGANVFRLRSYQNASRTLGGITEDLGELVATGQIFEIKGIGKGLGSAIYKGWRRSLAK